MKHIFITLTWLASFIPHTQAQTQTFAANLPAMRNEVTTPSLINFPDGRPGNRNARSAMITGFICMGAGALMFVGGVDLALSADNENNTNNDGHIGVAILVGGVVVFVTGAAMAIVGGSVYHHSKKHGYSIITPKKNQIGLAYNF